MAKKVKISKGERTKGFINGFKDFVLRGNVIDMAVGVIIGGAFGKIVTSLVNDIILPPIGVLLGGVEFRELQALISSSPVLDENSNQVIIDGVLQFNNVYIRYGNLIQTVVEFLIIAISIYVVLYIFIKRREQEAKLILTEEERLKKLEEENKPEEPEVVSPDILLLTEIRDLLKKDE